MAGLNIQTVAQLLSAFGTIAGLFFVGNQVRLAKINAHSLFINELSKEFEQYIDTVSEIVEENDGNTPVPKDFDQKAFYIRISPIISFFEKMEFLIKQKSVRIGELDMLFRKRFFALLQNKKVRLTVLDHPEFQGHLDLILNLEKRWRKHIKKRKEQIPGENTVVLKPVNEDIPDPIPEEPKA